MVVKTLQKQIADNLKKLPTLITNTNQFIQETAILIVMHAKEHGDCRSAYDLVKALPKSYRRNYLIDWFSRVSPIKVDMSEKATKPARLRKPESKEYNPFNLDYAKDRKWWDGPDPTAKEEKTGFDFEEYRNKVASYVDMKIKGLESLKETAPDMYSEMKARWTNALAAFQAEPKVTAISKGKKPKTAPAAAVANNEKGVAPAALKAA